MNPVPSRRFSAHCANEGVHRSDFATLADSFEAAALLFAERWLGAEAVCRIVVTDEETGEARCFTLDLGPAALLG